VNIITEVLFLSDYRSVWNFWTTSSPHHAVY